MTNTETVTKDIIRDNAGRPRLLIEEWLPAAAIGVECMRERSTGQNPPNARLHVWWARRPLAVSRAAVLGSLLPANFDRSTFEHLMGFEKGAVHLVEIRKLMDTGFKVPGGFNAQRAFKAVVPAAAFTQLELATKNLWGNNIQTLDLFSGGGSIPLESARMGFASVANELNPVACTVLEASDVYPFTFGLDIATRARRWGVEWNKRVTDVLGEYFPAPKDGTVQAYIYARTVPCPDTGHATPLVSDWTLMNPGKNATYAQTSPDKATGNWHLEIAQGGVLPTPTFKGGNGISIFTGAPIAGEYIKAKAQQGEMGSVLYAIAVKRGAKLEIRLPTQMDLDAIAAAEERLAQLSPVWQTSGVIPTETIGLSNYDRGHRMYGIFQWTQMFTPRQLLAVGTLVETLTALRSEILVAEGEEMGLAVEHLLAFAINKFANHNTQLSRLEITRGVIKGIFDRHNYEMKWTHAEMAPVGASSGLAWTIDNVLSAYEEIAKFSRHPNAKPVEIIQGSATSLLSVDDKSVTAVITDPPYDDNVQYSELADFFYVWLKRTQGHRRPEWFSSYLTDRTEEAIVNKKFHELPGMKPKEAEGIARTFYRDLMMQSFAEAHRVLRDDGALTVMFTHKKQEAWAALFDSLIQAGFTITATWPIKTESEHSLHQAKQNAAQSTVLLVARKRIENAGIGFFTDELRHEIQQAARSSAERLKNEGLNGVDQLVGSFGPAMEVYSRYDEVRTDTGEAISVAAAIDLAAQAVSQWRVEQLAGQALDDVEPEGKFTLLCWDVLGAAEFRFNEAKLLGNAVGMGVDQLELAGLVKKTGEKIKILSAQERRRDKAAEPDEVETMFGLMPSGKKRAKKMTLKIHPSDPAFRTALDAAQALALRFIEGGGGLAGIGSARQLANQQGFKPVSSVARLMAALVKAAPEALRFEGGKDSVAAQYPEFRAWHALLEPVFGLTPEPWVPTAMAVDNQGGLFSAAAAKVDPDDADLNDADLDDAEDDADEQDE